MWGLEPTPTANIQVPSLHSNPLQLVYSPNSNPPRVNCSNFFTITAHARFYLWMQPKHPFRDCNNNLGKLATKTHVIIGPGKLACLTFCLANRKLHIFLTAKTPNFNQQLIGAIHPRVFCINIQEQLNLPSTPQLPTQASQSILHQLPNMQDT